MDNKDIHTFSYFREKFSMSFLIDKQDVIPLSKIQSTNLYRIPVAAMNRINLD